MIMYGLVISSPNSLVEIALLRLPLPENSAGLYRCIRSRRSTG